MGEQEDISLSRVLSIDLGCGVASAELQLPRELFYQTLSSQSGFTVADDGDLMELLTELAGVKARFDKVSDALNNVYETGYGIVMPTMEELLLEEPEVMRQGGRYGIKLRRPHPDLGVKHLWPELPRAGQRGSAGEALPDAYGCAAEIPGDASADCQRGQRRPYLHHPINSIAA